LGSSYPNQAHIEDIGPRTTVVSTVIVTGSGCLEATAAKAMVASVRPAATRMAEY
jgi:hypothetical protein